MRDQTRRAFLKLLSAIPALPAASRLRLTAATGGGHGYTLTTAQDDSVTFYDEGVLALGSGAIRWESVMVTCHLMRPGYVPEREHAARHLMADQLTSFEYVPQQLKNKRVFTKRGWITRKKVTSLTADSVHYGHHTTFSSYGCSLIAWHQPDHPKGHQSALCHYDFGACCESYDGEFEVVWHPDGIVSLST